MLLVRETRCGVDEIRHEGAVAIVDKDGLHSHGDTSTPLALRSTAKPFILGALLDVALADETFSQAELALMSASHNGEPQHVTILLELLSRYDISPELLKCGIHDKWTKWSIQNPLGNNCSGKHAAFLIASKVAGYSLADYTDLDTKLNSAVFERLSRCFGERPNSVGVDGCSIPTCAFRLEALARAYFGYATDSLGENYARVRAAHRAAAFFVGGTDRLESYLIRSYGLAVKSGSDGLWAFGVPGDGIGVALKAWSGIEAAVQAVALEILDKRGIVDLKKDKYLSSYHTRPKKSLVNTDVGMIEVCFSEHLST